MEQPGAEQNKTEEATPFKLKRGREKGMVARGMDLGFFSTLVALSIFLLAAGDHAMRSLSGMMRTALLAAPAIAQSPQQAQGLAAAVSMPVLGTLVLLCATAILIVGLFEIVQVGGIVFTTQPLKPDFNRLNPAQGLKRLFSLRMLKETLKNILKMAAYAGAAYLVIRAAFTDHAQTVGDTFSLAATMKDDAFRLLFVFVVIALAVAALDQILARSEFRKQMRMSRSELTREHKEREGEPRMKQRRRQMHAEFIKQTRALGDLRGSDMLIVNPQHYAVALAYDPDRMSAPTVTAKGRNRFALLLKRKAALSSIAIMENPPLARALYRACDKGREIPPTQYAAVADLYLKLKRGAEPLADADA